MVRFRLVLGIDAPLVSELVTTRESSDGAGNKTYTPLRRDEEHITDGLRALALAIRDLDRAEDSPVDAGFGGWAGALTWKAPWS